MGAAPRLGDLAGDNVAVPEEGDFGMVGASFGNAPPERIVGVGPHSPIRAGRSDHLVLGVPAKTPRLRAEGIARDGALHS